MVNPEKNLNEKTIMIAQAVNPLLGSSWSQFKKELTMHTAVVAPKLNSRIYFGVNHFRRGGKMTASMMSENPTSIAKAYMFSIGTYTM